MRIAIVNDLIMAVEALRRVITLSTDHEIIWTAENGQMAVEQCAANKPDLILMDLIMPVMDGVNATKIIMENTPCAILVVTSSVEGNADKVFRAMGAGALDAVNTPVIESGGELENKNSFLQKLTIINSLISSSYKLKQQDIVAQSVSNIIHNQVNLVAIGASSGGPQALKVILDALPQTFRVPIVIIQHVDQGFAPELAAWLNSSTELNVKLAENNVFLEKGNVYIAGKNSHLVIDENMRTKYTPEPSDLPYIPSVNVFFDSLVENWKGNTISVLLTGMGNDGADGLSHLRQQGDYTITQDEKSCAVYGMPKAAASLNAAREILPLEFIAARISQLLLEQS